MSAGSVSKTRSPPLRFITKISSLTKPTSQAMFLTLKPVLAVVTLSLPSVSCSYLSTSPSIFWLESPVNPAAPLLLMVHVPSSWLRMFGKGPSTRQISRTVILLSAWKDANISLMAVPGSDPRPVPKLLSVVAESVYASFQSPLRASNWSTGMVFWTSLSLVMLSAIFFTSLFSLSTSSMRSSTRVSVSSLNCFRSSRFSSFSFFFSLCFSLRDIPAVGFPDIATHSACLPGLSIGIPTPAPSGPGD
mmetsp:Transcript_27489/g.67863  ORF Transcript_27489/g.67863 Transcript_27489/m.67863 type:complete len:247 (+) Transcript_27489:434-1174(+)